jgi:hypothetical protein
MARPFLFLREAFWLYSEYINNVARKSFMAGKVGFKGFYWLILAVAPVLLVFHALLYWYLNGDITDFTPEKIGAMGDSFGWLNALFSGLAFSGLLITILLQRHELQLQRQELSLQRKEMRDSRGELAKAALAQQRSGEIAALIALISDCDWQFELFEKRSAGVAMPPSLQKLMKDKDFDQILQVKVDLIRKLGSFVPQKV